MITYMKELSRVQNIERSLMKKYRKQIWTKFILALKRYNLVEDGDKIAVCVSGGKDSFLLAKLMQMLQRYSDTKFELVFLCMDPGYSAENRKKVEENAKLLEIPLQIFETDIFDSVVNVQKNPCYLCARMRRGYLYNKAKELGCNKIALGHHFDDVIETTLLSMLYGAEIKTMMPKLHSENFIGLELIRPLYLIKEKDIMAWAKSNDLIFLNCACKFTEAKASTEEEGKRKEVKKLIQELKKQNEEIDHNIFKALDNINLNCVLGTKRDGKYESFLDTYEK